MTTTTTSAALDLMAALVLEDGNPWGAVASQHQWDDAGAVLDPTGPRRHYLTRPRGGSKTTDLGGVAIAALVEQLPPMAKGYAFAADREQAGLLLDAIAGFKARTPGLPGVIDVGALKVTNLTTGAALHIMAADDASAWGLRPHLVIADEFAQWPDLPRTRRLWSAIFSALPKVADSRLVILTSAGDPAHSSHRVLEEARGSERWRVSEMPGPTPWLSPADLAEQRVALSEWEYRRLILNEWAAADDRLTSVDALRRCVTLDGPLPARPDVRYVVAVDLGLKSDRTVLAVCHAEEAGGPRLSVEEVAYRRRLGVAVEPGAQRVVLDRMLTWQGSRGRPVELAVVEDAVLEVSRAYGRARVVFDPWQAVGMAQRLRGQGVSVEEFTFSSASVGRLAGTLHRLLRDGLVALPDDDELLEELAHVRLVEKSPGVVRMDHASGRHDDRAVTLAMAAQVLLSVPPPVGAGRARDLRLRGRR